MKQSKKFLTRALTVLLVVMTLMSTVAVGITPASAAVNETPEEYTEVIDLGATPDESAKGDIVVETPEKKPAEEEDDSAAKEEEKTPARPQKGDIADVGANVEVAPTAWDQSAVTIYFDAGSWSVKTLYVLIGHGSWSSCYSMTKDSGTIYKCSVPSWGGATEWYIINADSGWGDEGNSPTHRKAYASNASSKRTSALTAGTLYTTSGTKTFTVTFKDWDGTTLKTQSSIKYKGSATAPSNPSRASTAQYTYTFSKWDKSYSSVTSDLTVTAVYTSTVRSYKITVGVASGTGTVSGGGTYDYGTSVTIKATAGTGYSFSKWSDGNTTASRSITVTGAATYNATFTINSYKLTLNRNYAYGTVSGAGTYDYNTKVSISASPNTGYHFVNWTVTSGNSPASTTSASTTVTLTKATTLQANFAINTYTLTLNRNNTSGGTVTGAGTYNYNTAASIKATPATGYNFTGWTKNSGNSPASTSAASTTVTLTSNTTLTANFTIKSYTVTFKDHDGTTLKTQSVNHGSAATAPSDPSRTGYNFAGWDKSFSSITANTTVTATYTIKTYTVTFKDDAAVGGGTLKTQTVNHGSAATAPSVSPSGGWEFYEWDKSFSNITANTTVTAVRSNQNVQLLGDGDIGGWTTGTARRMTYNSGGTNTKTVTLPKGTYQLKLYTEEWGNWLGNNGTVNDSCSGWDMYDGNNLTLNASGGKYTFTYTRSTKKLTISYSPVTYTVTMKAGTGGTATATSTTVNLGDTTTIKATPSTGYHFSSWSIGSGATISSGSTTSASATITVTGNVTCTASFAGNAGTVKYVTSTGGSVSNAGENSVTYPNEKQSKATPSTGYSFSKWTISGGTSGTDYTISTGSTTSATIGIKVITAGKTITATASFTPTTRNIKFAAGTGGSVSNSGTHSTTYPATQASTATAGYGYNFSSWTISGGTLNTDYKITAGGTDQTSITIQPLINGDTITATANFTKKSYTVSTTATTGGSASAGATSVKYNNTTTLTATPATGYKFVKWEITSNDSSHASTLSSTTANPATLTVNCNVTVKAHFEKQTYTVTMAKTPTAGGSVSANSTSVKYKESTTITATPATGYTFTKWEITSGTGSLGSATSASTTLTVESNVTVRATFTINKYTVTFKDQADFGGETLATVTVNHGSGATAPSAPSPEGGWEFWGWDKDFSNVTGNMTVTAVRANKNVQLMGLNSGWNTGTSMRMTYNANGTNTKTVRLTKGTYELKIYTEEFGDWRGNNGTVVDTTDTTASAGWDMDGGNNLTLEASGGSYTFTYYRNTNKLKITYSALTNKVTAAASPTAGGSTSVSNANVKIGDETTVSATANKGYTFQKWTFSGDYTLTSGSATSATIKIKPNPSGNGNTVTATATFVGNAGTVKYAATTGGSVTNAGNNAVTYPTEVKSTATVSEGYTFSKWSITGGTEGTDYVISTGSLSATTIGIKVYTSGKTITATAAFTANTSTIQFATSTGGSVSNSGSHSTTYPNTAKSTATPAASHNFVKWTITGGTKGTDYKIVSGSETGATIEIQPLTKGKTIKATAEFAIKTYTVKFVNWDGTELNTQVINHGSGATAPTNPTRPSTAQYSYAFKAWDKDFSNVTSNLTVTATYTETVRSYTVTFKDYNGTVLKEESVKYGSGATAPADPKRTDGFIFDGWDKTFNNITGNLTVTAKYYDDNVYLVGIKGVWEANSSTKMSYANTSSKTYELDEGVYEFKFIYRGAWLSNNGEVTNTTDYAGSSNPWETYDGNNCKLNAVGGTYEFKFNKSNQRFEVKHTPITYTVKFISDGKTVSTQKVNRGEDAKAPADPIKAATAQFTYTFAGWDKDFTGVRSDLTITAKFTQTLNKYTVTFKDYEGTVLKTEQVEYGKAATAPASPSREGYNFAGWDTDFSDIKGNLTVTAKYAIKTYTVKFKDYNGTELKTQVVEHGQAATAPQNPTRPADAQYTYTFKEWDKAFNKVTENLTVTATYTGTLNYYTVKFVNWDGYVYSSQSVAYGTSATAPSDPKRTDGWNFIGWDGSYTNIKGDTTVTAQWEDNNVYLMGVTGTWEKNENTLSQIKMTYNSTATMSLQLNAGQYKFKFIYKDTWRGNNGAFTDTTNNNGVSNPWETDPNAGDITLNATGGLYTFKYNKNNNRFEVLFVSNAHDVTFKNWDGSVIATKKVPDGESAAAYAPAASRPADVKYTYTHSGWTPDINQAITANKTFTATYTETLNKYTVTFVNWDNTVLKTENVEYGKAATAPDTTPTRAGNAQYSYTFKGWDTDFSAIEGATTVKAEFTPVVNKYNVTFVYYKADGKTQTSTVVSTEYGSAAVPPTVPARTDGMAFEKWDKGYSNIVSDLTVNAVYFDNNYYLKGSFNNWETGNKLNTYGDTVVTTTVKLDPGTYTFKINQANNWFGNGGIIQDTTTATSNVGWEMSANADDCTLKASGGTYIFKYNTQTRMLVVEYEPTMFTVTFKNWDGTVIGTEKVAISTAAKGPATPTKPSTVQYIYTFTGWDKDISKVTSDITTTAQFMESVRQYTITFVYKKADGTETSVDKLVEYGRDATAPEVPRRNDGWEFSHWDKEFKAIQGDMTVTAQYIDGNVYLPASFNNFDEKALPFSLTSDENVYTQKVTLDGGTYTFKLKVGDGWYGNNGTIKDTTSATSQVGWEMSTGADNCTLEATGGTYTFTYNKSTRMLTVDYDPYKYTVTFVDNKGATIDKQTVAIGTAASDPKAKVPFRADGYAFEKWDKDFTNVTGNMTVTAQYFDNNIYLKGDFNNWDDSNTLNTYGNDVTSTRVELAPGTYEFKFFRNNLVEGTVTGTYYTDTNAGTVKDTTGNDWWNTSTSNGVGNTKINATGGWYTFSFNSKTGAFNIAYEPYMYTVTYKDYNGKVLGTESVAIGKDAKGMTTPKRNDGWEFHYWEPSIKNIQGDTTVTAVYYDHNVYLVGDFNNWDTDALKMNPDGENVVKARIELKTTDNYEFKFYQKNLVDGQLVDTYYTDQNAGMVDNTTMKEWWHTVDQNTESRNTTLKANGGFYEFSFATDTKDFHIFYDAYTFEVVFRDYNENVLKTEQVPIGTAATPPKTPTRAGGWVFRNWDIRDSETDDFSEIWKPTTIYATYYDANVYLKGDFNNWGTNHKLTQYGDRYLSVTLALEPGTYDFKFFQNRLTEDNELIGDLYTDINAGTIEDEMAEDEWWDTTTEDPGDTNLVAKGGWYTFTFDTETKKFNISYKPNIFDVTFVYYSADGKELINDVQQVRLGENAVAPEVPVRTDNWVFDKWDKEFTNIQGELTVTALYIDENIYVAGSFNDWNEKATPMNGTTDSNVVQVTLEFAPGTYEFKIHHGDGWYTDKNAGTVNDTTGNDWWNTTTAGDVGNTKLQATGGYYTISFNKTTNAFNIAYEPYMYTVTFVDYEGKVLKEEEVAISKDATAPAVPARTDGWVFIGWDKEFSKITEDITVTAQYRDDNVYLRGFEDDWAQGITMKNNGDNTVTATVRNLTAGGYEFKFFYDGAWYTNEGVIENSIENWETYDSDKNCTLQASGGSYTFTFNKETKRFSVEFKPNIYHVTFHYYGKTSAEPKTDIVEVLAGGDVELPALETRTDSWFYLFWAENKDGKPYGTRYTQTITNVTGDMEIQAWYFDDNAYLVGNVIDGQWIRTQENIMTYDFESGISTKVVHLAPGQYAFKVIHRHDESMTDYMYGNNGTIYDTAYDWDMSTSAGDCVLNATGGTYTFTFNRNNKRLSVSYEPDVFTVTFVEYDGTILDTQEVKIQQAAKEPAHAQRTDGWVFFGWDSDTTTPDLQGNTQKIMGDTTFVASYYDDNVYLAGDFNGWNETEPMGPSYTSRPLVTSMYLEPGTYEFKLLRNGAWYGNNGTIEDATTTGWKMTTEEGNCTLDATGGYYTFKYDPDTQILEVLYDATQFYVRFLDWNGTVLKEGYVSRGDSAVAPTEIPTKEGDVQYSYTFTGWDVDFSNIQENLDVTAVYLQTVNEYKVTFKYYAEDGTTLISDEQMVPYGEAATAPEVPAREDRWVFSHWDVDFSNITGDLTVTAQYINGNVFLAGTFNDWNETTLPMLQKTDNPDEFATTIILHHGETNQFKIKVGDSWYGNTGVFTDTTDVDGKSNPWDMTHTTSTEGNCTINTTGGYYTFTYNIKTQKLDVKYQPFVYTVTFIDYNDVVISTQQIEITKDAELPTAPKRTGGFEFLGWDSDLTAEGIQDDCTNIMNDMTFYAQYYDNNLYLKGSLNNWGTNNMLTEYGEKIVTTTIELGRGTYTFKFYRESYDENGDLIKVYYTDVNAGRFTDSTQGWWNTTDDPGVGNTTLDATGGYYTFEFNNETEEFRVIYEPYMYTVTFVDWDNTVLKTETLAVGSKATAPEDPTRESTIQYNYVFAGWDQDFSYVESDMTIKALYDAIANEYTVTFVDWDGTVLKTEEVLVGTAAEAPEDPTRDGGMKFSGWDKDFSDIQGDLTVTAQYYDDNVYLVGNFNGWNKDNKLNTYGDLVVSTRVELAPGTYEFKFMHNGTYYTDKYAGTVVNTTGENWWGTTTSDEVGNTKLQADGGWYTFTFDTVTKEFHVAYEPYYYTVKFVDWDGKLLKEESVQVATSAEAPEEPTREHYNFTGWDKDFSNIQGDLTVTAQYKIHNFTVTFVYYAQDSKTLIYDEQTVDYSSPATAPENIPVRNDGWVFDKWDRDFNFITEDITVTAEYIDDNVYLVGDFNGWDQKAHPFKLTDDPNVVTLTLNIDSDTEFKLKRGDGWFSNQGTIPDTTDVDGKSNPWDMSTSVSENCTLDASGGSYTFTYNKATQKLEVKYAPYIYTVKFVNWDGTLLKEEYVQIGRHATPPTETPTRPADDQYAYIFAGWDTTAYNNVKGDLTVTATYTTTINEFTVKFVNWDGTVLSTQTVVYGKDAIAPAEKPTRPADAQFTYTFKSWDKEFTGITADTVVTATYNQTLNVYTVTFVDWNGTVLKTEKVVYGNAATAPASPTRENYVFKEWDKDFTKVEGDLTVTATYVDDRVYLKGDFNNWKDNLIMKPTGNENEYSITIKVDEGTSKFKLTHQDIWYGNDGVIVDTTETTSPGLGWEMSSSAGDCILDATGGNYTFIYNTETHMLVVLYEVAEYTVIFQFEDGTVISEQKVKYGESAQAPADPTMAGYVFIGWDPADFTRIIEDTIITALFAEAGKVFTVTFVDFDGTVIGEPQQVVSGQAAVAPEAPSRADSEDGQFSYTFTGWDKDFSAVAEDMTVTATYEQTVKEYKVTFSYLAADGVTTVTEEQMVPYGSAATAPEVPEIKDFIFTGWDADFSAITGELTVNATYAEQGSTFTVTFVDWDGTVIGEPQQVEAGTSAVAPEAPTRDQDKQYTYVFAGWDQDFSAVMSDMTVTANYTATLRKYTVTYENYNGAFFYSELVEYGKPAPGPMNPPTRPTSNGRTYTFEHWDKQDQLGYITEDITTKAVFTSSLITYTVTFVSYDGTVIGEPQRVQHGRAATAPEKPAIPAGYTSTWNPADFSYITSNLTVKLELIDNNVYISGDMNNWTDVTMTQTSTNGNVYSKTYELEEGQYEFKFRYPKDVWFGNNGTVYDSTDGWWSTSNSEPDNITLVAKGGTYEFQFNKQYKQMQVIYHAPEHTVTFIDWNGTVLSTQKVKHGGKAVAPADPYRESDAMYSYRFTGWDPSVENDIEGNTTFTAQYEKVLNSYTVTFMDWDGKTVLSSQKVDYGEAAVEPTHPTREHYTFSGWDSDDYTNVTGHLTITAQYVPDRYYVTVNQTANGTSSADKDRVDYPGTVTLTAEPDSGYSFSKWIIVDGTYDLGGSGSIYSREFTIIPTSDIVVKAEYVQGVELTVHGYSDRNYYNLYMWEQNSSNAKNEPVGVWPGTELAVPDVFNGVTWKSLYDLTLTNGYSAQVGAILNGTGGQTNDVYLQNLLYNGGVWAGIREIWIADTGSGTPIVTLRRELLTYIDMVKGTYNDGVNVENYTADTWDEFVDAYLNAFATSGSKSSVQNDIDTALEELRIAYENLKKRSYNRINVYQIGGIGSVTIGDVTITTASDFVQVLNREDATMLVTAPEGYYITSVIANGEAIFTNSNLGVIAKEITIREVMENQDVEIRYAPKSAYTITVEAYDENKGTIYYNNKPVNAAGEVIRVFAGNNATFKAEAKEGFAVYEWTVDGSKVSLNKEITISDINENHTVSITWQQVNKINVTIDANPAAAGNATAQSGDQQASTKTGIKTITIDQFKKVTLTAKVTDELYKFAGWSIQGDYTDAGSSTRLDETFEIIATSDITATAMFVQVYRKIYLDNEANWDQPYIYYWGSDIPSVEWPGEKMTYDETTGYWIGYIPVDSTGLQFNDGGTKQVEFSDVTPNLYNNGSGSSGTYVEEGYYLQGIWDGVNHTAEDLYKFDVDNGDGSYSITITVNSTSDGYIYVNPTNELSEFWNAEYSGKTDNPQILDYIGMYTDNPNFVKVELNPYDLDAGYEITFTFNPETGEFSWTKKALVPSITIIGTDGRGTNSADENMITSNDRVGKTYFENKDVMSVTTFDVYEAAQVLAGKPVTFYTKVNGNGFGDFDYYVYGWVINGTEFVPAYNMGDGLYSGSYIFTKDMTNVVPVYFHTNEWLAAHGVEQVTVYAVADKSIENWNQYLSVYTWNNDAEGLDYEQFGLFAGQLMIPVAGLDGVYYTFVETTSPTGVPVSGIIFNNYAKNDNFNTVIVDYDTLQSYDFYEFMALLEDGKDNITFVIKNTNDDYNSDRVDEEKDVYLNNFTFEQYTDYSKLKTDIFGNSIEAIDGTLSDSNAVYIIQAGDKPSHDAPLSGDYYVKCYIYDATGKFLGSCFSYELHDKDSAIWSILEPYKNQRAYISYEAANEKVEGTGDRYDGEWYGDSNLDVTINVSVNVGLTTDGGQTFYINTDKPVNVATYGSGYVNVSYQNLDVKRGTQVTLTATPARGYKFIGWYSADGTLFSTNRSYTVIAAVGTTYTAVFEEMSKGNFYVNHYLYTGIGTTSGYIPTAHGGNAQLYVGITNETMGISTDLTLTDTAFIEARVGDVLTITVATDAVGADKFYAWYVEAMEKNGFTSFEEVGVDSLDNLFNNRGTVVGRSDMVYFQFKYIVKENDSYTMTLYSDLMPVSADVTLVYNYNDRNGDVKTFYVPYTLTIEEIEGFAGNNYRPYTPAFISGEGWINTVLAYAPFVADLAKDTTWVINSAMYDTMTFVLWATQPDKLFTITSQVGDSVLVTQATYDSLYTIDVRDVDSAVSQTGFWYNDVNNDGRYTQGIDLILTYGPLYSYRVTCDMNINFEETEEFDFNITIDEPAYGREQTSNEDGSNKKDTVTVDYMINILTPYFYGQGQGNNFKPTDNIIGNPTGQHVTVESLRNAGYTVSHGVILEQVGSFAPGSAAYPTFMDALKAAQAKNYGVATDYAILKDVVENYNKPIMTSAGTYCTVYDTSNYDLTNKNRYSFAIGFNNTAANQKKFYNVYSYVIVTTPEGVSTTYISNVQTLNIYTMGTTGAVVADNANFA